MTRLAEGALIGEELLGLSLMVLLGKILGDLVERAGYSRLIGEIVGGALLGPYALGGLIDSAIGAKIFYLGSEVVFLSQLSVVLLVYASGLEHGVAPLRRAGAWGALGATFGALLPFLASIGLYRLGLMGFLQAAFVGAAIAPTSLAVVSGLLSYGVNQRVIDFLYSASAIDDVVSLVILTVALGLAQLRTSPSALTIARVIAFYAVGWVVIYLVSIRLIPLMTRLLGSRYVVEYSLVVLFGLIAVMQALGFSPIVAAFIAGVSLAESGGSEVLRELAKDLLLIFGSMFFVVVGAEVNFAAVGLDGLLIALLILGVALATKALGVMPFAYGYLRDMKSTIAASAGMEPRGEVGLAVAAVGLSVGALSDSAYGSLVLAIVLSTVIGMIAFTSSCRRPSPSAPAA